MAGTILFIVEDIGIVRVLPLIRMLVRASEQRQAMVRVGRIGAFATLKSTPRTDFYWTINAG